MTGARLSCRNLCWSAGNRAILRDVSFSASGGEFVGLVGPNGAGKTSLLRILDGIVQADEGTVELDGIALERTPPRDRARKIAFMMGADSVSVPLPVIDVLLSARYPYKRGLAPTGRDDRKLASSALGFVGLEGFEERSFPTLSSGERQLVLLARALVQETGILLLDEPTSNLDLRHRHRILGLVRRSVRDGRLAVAAVHDLNEAAAYCTRIVLMDRGRIAADDAPETVLRPDLLSEVFGIGTEVRRSPATGNLIVEALPGEE